MARREQVGEVEMEEIDSAGLSDIFTTGHITTEVIGPNTRIVFYAQKNTRSGTFHIPVAPIIVPTECVMQIAKLLAAASTLARSDFIGKTMGSG